MPEKDSELEPDPDPGVLPPLPMLDQEPEPHPGVLLSRPMPTPEPMNMVSHQVCQHRGETK